MSINMKEIEAINNNDAFLVKAKEYLQKSGVLNGNFNQTDIEMFLTYCKELKLNPFMNEVYAFITTDNYGKQQLRTVISYHVYLQWAEQSDKLDGWDYEFMGDGDDYRCVVTIYRKDWSRPFKHTVYLSDCGVIAKKDGTVYSRFKKGMERHMLMKTAVSQAMRLCLPTHMKSLPYTREEMLFYNDESNGNNNSNGNGNNNSTNQSIVTRPNDEFNNDNLWVDNETGDVYPLIKHPDVIKSCYLAIFDKPNARPFLNALFKSNKDLYNTIVKCITNKDKKVVFINDLEVYNDQDILLNEYNKLKGINNSNNNNNNDNNNKKDEQVKSNQSN
jgi:hypothetical protein